MEDGVETRWSSLGEVFGGSWRSKGRANGHCIFEGNQAVNFTVQI